MKRNLAASGLEQQTDVTRIDFPRPIGEGEVDELLKYFVAQLDERQPSNFSISVNFSQNRHYGERIERGMYMHTNDVMVTNEDTKIAGFITTTPSLDAASFAFRSFYGELGRPSFTGIDFIVTPDYEPGELNSDSVNIMRSMKQYVTSYFERADKLK